MEIPEQYKTNLYRALLSLMVVLSLFFIVKVLSEVRAYNMMGDREKTITLSGHGEIKAIPDTANIYFTIQKEGKTVKEAQAAVAAIEKKALDSLKGYGIDDKDIQTTNASFNPKYEYVYDTKTLVPCSEFNCPPRPGKSVISGYEAYENITVKIRKVDDVGKIMEELGTVGVTGLNGPNFTIDDEDALKAEARKMAIDDAREKAKELAKDLGVSLGSISSFSEGGGYQPVYFEKAMTTMDSAGVTAPAELPKGENTITSDVTITYEIR